MKLGGGETVVIESTVFEDNNESLTTANSIKMTHRTKHICVKYHVFEHHCGKGNGITLVKVNTRMQKADIFSKVKARRSS